LSRRADSSFGQFFWFENVRDGEQGNITVPETERRFRQKIDFRILKVVNDNYSTCQKFFPQWQKPNPPLKKGDLGGFKKSAIRKIFGNPYIFAIFNQPPINQNRS
jgi:hypothetical protein